MREATLQWLQRGLGLVFPNAGKSTLSRYAAEALKRATADGSLETMSAGSRQRLMDQMLGLSPGDAAVMDREQDELVSEIIDDETGKVVLRFDPPVSADTAFEVLAATDPRCADVWEELDQ